MMENSQKIYVTQDDLVRKNKLDNIRAISDHMVSLTIVTFKQLYWGMAGQFVGNVA